MSESKIGKWLTRDGRTAVVFCNVPAIPFPFQGMLQYGSAWISNQWCHGGWRVGIWQEDGGDLVRKVSDSTDLTPYIPVKRVRPWTQKQWLSKMPLALLHKKTGAVVTVAYITNTGWIGMCGGYGQHSASGMLEEFTQLDGLPCGVEVEE